MTPKSKSSPASALSILSTISEQKLGFKFGKPQRLGENALSVVLPIIRETSVKRQYITYPETDKVEIVDTGTISKMKVSSVSTDNVFIRSGTIFKGGTQERTLVRSVVVFPGKTMDIEVRCVHATRGINTGTKVGYGGVTPMTFDSANYSDGFRPMDQHTTWANVRSYTSALYKSAGREPRLEQSSLRSRLRSMRAPSARNLMRSSRSMGPSLYSSLGSQSHDADNDIFLNDSTDDQTAYANSISDYVSTSGLDDLHSAQLEFAKNFDDILSKITPVEDQSGIALINHNGCQTIETFDVPQSWASLHTDAVKRVGSHQINQNDSVFEYKPENAIRAAQSVLAQEYATNLIYEHKPSNGEPYVSIHGLTSREFVGEVVEIDNRVIHLLLTKRAA